MALTKVGSVGIATGISLTGVTTTQDAKVGTGITLSPDGDGYYTGIITATSYRGDVSNCTGVGQTNFIDAESLNVSGISTFTGQATVGTGITLSPDGDVFFTGVVTATSYAGDGSGLTGIAATDNVRTGILDVAGVGTFRDNVNVADRIIHVGDTNTQIRFPTADTFTVETNGTERVRVDSGGRLLIATTDIDSVSDGEVSKLIVKSTDSTASGTFVRHSADAGSGGIYIGKSRNATIGSNTIVQSGDELGRITFSGDDGTNINTIAARIQAFVDGTPGENDMPGRLTFSTTADGAASVTERLRIDSSGRVLIGHTASEATYYTGRIQVQGVNSAQSCISIKSNQADSGGPALVLAKSRGSLGGTTVVQDGDQLGSIYFNGADGTDSNSYGAEIRASVDGSPGSNDMPGRLGFYTTADGAATSTERLRITSGGQILMGGNTAYNVFENSATSPRLQVRGTDLNGSCQAWIRATADAGAPKLFLANTRSTAEGGQTIVQDDDELGGIYFSGSDGSQFVDGGSIRSYVDGSPGADDMPARLSFFLTRDGDASGNSREWMRITNNGVVTFAANDSTQSHANTNHRFVIDYANSDVTNPLRGLLVHASGGNGGGNTDYSYAAKFDGSKTHNNCANQYSVESTITQQYTANTHGIYSFNSSSYGTTYCYEARMNKNIGAATNGYCYHSNIWETNSGGASYHFRGAEEDTTKILILKNGNVQNVNNSYGSTSDVKLKENIVDANSQWNDLKAIKVRNFNFKDDPDKVKLLGVVAQEAETVSAGLVYDEKDITVGSNGEGTVTGTTKSVKYSILYMKAIKCLQEAQARIETLETKVAALESA